MGRLTHVAASPETPEPTTATRMSTDNCTLTEQKVFNSELLGVNVSTM